VTIHFTPRLSEAVLIYCASDFYDLPSTSLRETRSFARLSLSSFRGDSTLGCKCTLPLKHHKGQKTLHTSGLGALHYWNII